MKYLFSDWEKIIKDFGVPRQRLFLFDMDGTLASIEKSPEAVRVRKPVRHLLSELSNKPRTTVGVISGRQLDDVKNRIGLRRVLYAGNHGLEIFFGGSRQVQPAAKRQSESLQQIYKKAKLDMRRVTGALVEWKAYSVSLHYRRVSAKNKIKFNRVLKNLVPLVIEKGFQMRAGKKVVEILPLGAWNKGTAVKMLMKKYRKPVTLFIGDDVTDEKAFDVIKSPDVSVRVGRKESSRARYYLKNQREVKSLLLRLVAL